MKASEVGWPVREPLRVVDILGAGEPTEHRLAEQTAQLVARVLATAAIEELRDRHVGEPEGIIELAVREQTAVRGDLGAVELKLDSAVENGPQRQLFGFHPSRTPRSRSLVHPNIMGDNVTDS
jgi:hypothetical protein